MLQKLSNIYISTTEIQKVAKEIGSQLVSIEDQLIENPKEYKKAKKKIDKMVISMDGAKIKTNDGWKEVKSGVVYELDSKSGKKKKCSYVSRIEYFIDFGKRLKEEARRRHYLDTNHLITIGDGAKWIWDLVEKDYLNSIQIVDWYHAKQHLYNIIKLLFGDKKDTETQLFTEKLIELLYNGNIKRFDEIVHEKILETNAYENASDLADLHTELEYFKRNEKRMKYKLFKSKGYPIGSGIIEATCKQLVQLRLKRNGMKWSKEGAHCILQLRCLNLGRRWDEVKKVIWKKSA